MCQVIGDFRTICRNHRWMPWWPLWIISRVFLWRLAGITIHSPQSSSSLQRVSFHRHLFLVRPALLAYNVMTHEHKCHFAVVHHITFVGSLGLLAKRRQCCHQSSPSVGLLWYANHWDKHDSAPALCVVFCQVYMADACCTLNTSGGS